VLQDNELYGLLEKIWQQQKDVQGVMGTLVWSVARRAYFAKWFARLLHGCRARAAQGACIVAWDRHAR
jgi:hypothetical protein